MTTDAATADATPDDSASAGARAADETPAAADATPEQFAAAARPEVTAKLGTRVLDAESLRGLAHPLRQRLLDALSAYGPATASQLGARLEESSGATSYHLRQLEKHGFVEDAPEQGAGRERYWRRVPGALTIDHRAGESPATQAAARSLSMQWYQTRHEQMMRAMMHGEDVLAPEWVTASAFSSSYLRMTAEELAEATREFDRVLLELVERYRDRPTPEGARPVLVNINTFPIIEDTELPQ